MADEDKASKTEEATPKRRKEAFEEGNFPRAEEIQVAFGLMAAFISLLFLLTHSAEELALFAKHIFANIATYSVNHEAVVDFTGKIGGGIMNSLSPVFSVIVIFGIIAGGLQTKFGLTPKVLKVKPQKINPINGFKQKYGPQAMGKFGIDFLKFIFVALVIFFAVQKVIHHEIFSTIVSPFQVVTFIHSTTLYMASLLVASMGLIAAINYMYQRYTVNENLKMSKNDVKDEHKASEGDPMIKSARQRMARQLIERQMFAAVPDADLVVTNPTHFAVALRYDREQEDAPIVLAKGKNLVAQRIKELARDNGVPVIENKPVARSLYKLGKPGQQIPAEMYQVVAEVLAYVYRVHRRYFERRDRLRKRQKTA